MAYTTNECALESLNLQRESHLRRIRLLQARIQQDEKFQDKSNEQVKNSDSSLTKTPFDAVQKTVEDFDSLLQFLYDQRAEGNSELSEVEKQEKSDKNLKESISSGRKIAKDDMHVIEELRTYGEALRGHVETMLHEVDTKDSQLSRLRAENQALLVLLREAEEGKRQFTAIVRENEEMKHRLNDAAMARSQKENPDRITSSAYNPIPVGMDLEKLTGMELPPLEMPSFDFDSLSNEK